MPSNSTDYKSSTGVTRSRNRFDKKWLIACVLIILVIIAGVLINNNSSDNSPTKVAGLVDIDNGDLKINWERYTVKDIELSNTVTITDSGIYHLTGDISDGSIIVDTGVKGEVKLILDNVSIVNTTGPAIQCLSGDDLVIELVGRNLLQDGTSYDGTIDKDIDGTIYSKADLTFTGDGTLDIIANYQDAIVGKDDVKFNNGRYNIIAADDGIRGKDSVYIVNGNFDITSGQDAVKSTNDTDANKGFVLVENGTLYISAGDDGIHGEHTLIVQSGTINVAKSYEGIESQKIVINGGNISLSSSDDDINAGSSSSNTSATQNNFDVDENCEIIINDGDIYINSSGDGLDSNGQITINGGKLVVDGPTNNGNGALDSGTGIVMNDGSLFAVGSSGMAESLDSNSSIFSINVYFNTSIPANTRLEIKDSTGNTIIDHISAKAFTNAVIGSTDFSLGSTYSIYLDNEKYQDFTISNIVTVVGNSRANTNVGPPRDHK